MKKIILIAVLIISFLSVKSQILRPSGSPNPSSAGFSKIGYALADSGFLWGIRDTFPASKYTTILHTNGNFYKTPGGVGSHWSIWIYSIPGSVTSVATSAPVLGGPITTTGTIGLDTGRSGAQIPTGYDLNKVRDSVVQLIAEAGGGTVLSFSSTASSGIIDVVTLPATTPTQVLSLGNITPSSVSTSGGITATFFVGDGRSLGGVVKYTDTASMLSNLLRKTDTAQMLSNYLRRSDPLATLTFGTHLTGGSYNGLTPITLATDATSAATGSTIVSRDASGDVNFRDGYFRNINLSGLTGGNAGDLLVNNFGSIVTRTASQIRVDIGALAIADTAAMLSNYLRKSDTSLITNGYVRTIGVTTANGVSGVSSGGHNPLLTVTLGAITPSSIITGLIQASGLTASGTIQANGMTLTNDLNVRDLYARNLQLSGITNGISGNILELNSNAVVYRTPAQVLGDIGAAPSSSIYWTRSGITLTPVTLGDAISTTGNIIAGTLSATSYSGSVFVNGTSANSNYYFPSITGNTSGNYSPFISSASPVLNGNNGNIEILGNIIGDKGIHLAYKSVSSTYAITATGDFFVDCIGTFTVTLPNGATTTPGYIFVVKNSGTGTITIDATGPGIIDGGSSVSLSSQFSSYMFQGDGSNGWKIIGAYAPTGTTGSGVLTVTGTVSQVVVTQTGQLANIGLGTDITLTGKVSAGTLSGAIGVTNSSSGTYRIPLISGTTTSSYPLNVSSVGPTVDANTGTVTTAAINASGSITTGTSLTMNLGANINLYNPSGNSGVSIVNQGASGLSAMAYGNGLTVTTHSMVGTLSTTQLNVSAGLSVTGGITAAGLSMGGTINAKNLNYENGGVLRGGSLSFKNAADNANVDMANTGGSGVGLLSFSGDTKMNAAMQVVGILTTAGIVNTGSVTSTNANITGSGIISGMLNVGSPASGFRMNIGASVPTSNDGSVLGLQASNSATNWITTGNVFTASAYEITPSTAGGGTSYSTPKFSMTAAGVLTLSNLGSGAVQATAGTLSVVSSSQFKNDLGYFKGNALNAIMKIDRGHYYTWNNRSKLPQGIKMFGLFADKVYDVLGEEFAPTQKDGMHSLSDRALLSLTIQALQEETRKVETLEARIAALEKLIKR